MADRSQRAITRARGMRREPSEAERALWKLLRSGQLNAKFRRQHPIDPYIADFACIAAKLAIEVDGGDHAVEDQRAYDERRTIFLNEQGWRVLRFRSADVLSDPSTVLAQISAALVLSPPSGGES